MSNLFKLNLKDVLGAVLSASLFALCLYVLDVGDVFALDIKSAVNAIVLSGVVAFVSLLKSVATDSEGRFLGGVKVK